MRCVVFIIVGPRAARHIVTLESSLLSTRVVRKLLAQANVSAMVCWVMWWVLFFCDYVLSYYFIKVMVLNKHPGQLSLADCGPAFAGGIKLLFAEPFFFSAQLPWDWCGLCVYVFGPIHTKHTTFSLVFWQIRTTLAPLLHPSCVISPRGCTLRGMTELFYIK